LEKNVETMTNQINELKKENNIFKNNKKEFDVLIKEKEDIIYQLQISNDEFKKKLDFSDDEKQKVWTTFFFFFFKNNKKKKNYLSFFIYFKII